MLVRNIKATIGLTLNNLYRVFCITEEKGRRTFLIADDSNFFITEKHQETLTHPNLTLMEYPEDIFDVIDERVPESWITSEEKYGFLFGKKIKTTSFPSPSRALYQRASDGSEPDRSYLFHKLQELHSFHKLPPLIPSFKVIPENHLENINWPIDVLDDWVDPIDGKIFKSNSDGSDQGLLRQFSFKINQITIQDQDAIYIGDVADLPIVHLSTFHLVDKVQKGNVWQFYLKNVDEDSFVFTIKNVVQHNFIVNSSDLLHVQIYSKGKRHAQTQIINIGASVDIVFFKDKLSIEISGEDFQIEEFPGQV